MSADAIVARLRLFLLSLSFLSLVVTLTELLLEEHYQELLQLIPFVLGGAGLLALVAALLRPGRATLLALRGVMAGVALGGIIGTGIHLLENAEFAQEIRPNAALGAVLGEALKGAAPLLAPGALIFAALLALAATYYHPLLSSRADRG
jgi:hypothetical protein